MLISTNASMVTIFVSSIVHVLIMMAVILVNVMMVMKVMAEPNVKMLMNAQEGSANAVNSQYALTKKVPMTATVSMVTKTSLVALVKYAKTLTNVPLEHISVQH